jgi:transposase
VTTVEKVKKDLSGWKLSRCVWVMDRGMNSEQNRAILQQAGGHYILGEKLRDNQVVHEEVLRYPGPFHKVRENLKVKEIFVGQGERRRRFVLAYNPEQAKKDRVKREELLRKMEETLVALRGPKKDHPKAVRKLLAHGKMGPYLRQLKSGRLKIDRSRVRAEQYLDGKYLLSTSDDSLSAEDVALGYKQLLEVERAFRTLKTTLDLRPLYHRKDERIEAHVFLCFLALLLVRIAERQTGQTWDQIRAILERIHLGEFESKNGRILQRTELTPDQIKLLKVLKISSPPKIQKVDLST